MHQGSVLSPLLFAAVMDVVSSEVRSGLPCKLLYGNDLVIITPTMEQLGRRVAEWRASLPDKGLKVNAGKSKVMVGSSGRKMVESSGRKIRVQNRRSLLAKCECERLRSSTQVSTLARNIEYQKAKRHRGCLHYDLFIAQL